MYKAQLNESFSEGEFDHIVLLHKQLPNQIDFRKDEIKELKRIPVDDLMDFISDRFNQFADIQNM